MKWNDWFDVAYIVFGSALIAKGFLDFYRAKRRRRKALAVVWKLRAERRSLENATREELDILYEALNS